jgi:RNA polymerase sigma factor (sigma-70 family)
MSTRSTSDPPASTTRLAPSSPEQDQELAEIVRSARAGDRRAWERLYARFTPMLRRIAGSYRLAPADAEDAVQTTWLRLVDNIARVREPAAVGAWLAITARREALRTLQRGVRELPSAEPQPLDEAGDESSEDVASQRERRFALHAAVRRLPGRQRDLLSEMLRRPCASYDEIAGALTMPVGSIGPTRERALSRLRDDAALAAVLQA